MARIRILFLVALSALFGVLIYLALRGWAGPGLAEVKEVPDGHQEIAWISPATGSEAWERLVAALHQLQEDWKGTGGKSFQLSLDKAFLELTADVPEIALWLDGAEDARLWIRWYKLSGENDSRRWVEKLRRRSVSPLAIIGGETSDRALTMAKVLEEARGQWAGAAPLFIITTATAERYYPRAFETGDVAHETWPKLMDVYPQRTFRFAFTNTRMVEAVLDFVWKTPGVWAPSPRAAQVMSGVVASAHPWTGLGFLGATGHLQPPVLYSLAWWDDGYSRDLAEIFTRTFVERGAHADPERGPYNDYIDYSVGDFSQANPREAIAVDLLLANNPRCRHQQGLLALPTGTQRARRFLRTLCRRAPLEARNLVVITGDAITFNNVYRDRDVAWNIRDMPVPLVFFSHRNPIDAAAGFGRKNPQGGPQDTTGTQDLLLNRDIFEALLAAAFDQGRLLDNADRIVERMQATRWQKGRIRNGSSKGNQEGRLFFDAAGNRQPGTGEHVVWLQPAFEGARNLPEAIISVWRVQGGSGAWRMSGEPLHVLYDRPREEGSNVHGGE